MPRRVGRPPKASPFRAKVSAWLAEDSKLTTDQLLWRAIDEGYAGHKTAFYELVASIRGRAARAPVRSTELSRERALRHVDAKFVDGTKRRVRFYVSPVEDAKTVAVTIVDDGVTESIVLRPIAQKFAACGGLHLLGVLDRSRKEGDERNARLYDLAADRSARERDAGARFVDLLQKSFFEPRTFRDGDDLRAKLDVWLVDVARDGRPKRTPGGRHDPRRDEISLLVPVPDPTRRSTVVTLFLGSDRVRILATT